MSYTKKTFEELDVIDDFLMNAIATDPEVGEAFCRKTLSVLLQRNVGKIKVVAQRTIPAITPKHRGIRMDVEVEEFSELSDEKMPVLNVYDIEPHNKDAQYLPKRNRFYQAKIDSRYLRCGEIPELEYEDGLKFIYFNTKGTKGGNKEIQNLLSYIQNSREKSVTDETTREIHEYVSRVRVQPEVRQEYKKYEEIIAYERRDAAVLVKRNDILELLEEYGEIPQSLREKIGDEADVGILKRWLKLAARVDTIQEFTENM